MAFFQRTTLRSYRQSAPEELSKPIMANMTTTTVMDELLSMEPTSWVALGVTFVLLVALMKYLTAKSMKLPPGPTNLPILGALFSLSSQLHRSFTDLSKTYGPIVYFKLGSLPVVVVSSAEVAKELLKEKDAEFSSRANTKILYSASKYFGFEGQGIALAPNTPLLHRLRKASTTELFSRAKIMSANSMKIRHDEMGAMVRELACRSKTGEPVKIADILLAVAMNTICRVLFGKRYYGSDLPVTRELMEFKHFMLDLATTAGKLNISDLLPALRSLDLQGLTREFAELHVRQRSVMSGILEDHKKNRSPTSEDQDFVDSLLALEGEDKVTDVQIMAAITDLLVGGTDTSSITTEWALIEILRHPDILSKLSEEVESVVGKERAVSTDDLPNLPYLQAVSKEILRLFPPLTTNIPRMNEHGASKLAGYDIPQGSSVFLNAWAIGRDPAFWERPEEFIPERFLGSDIQSSGTHFQYLPFGSGRRRCPGVVMGQIIVQQAIATLVHAFDLQPPEGMKHSDISNRDSYGIVLRPADPLFLRATLKVPLQIYATE